MFPLPIITYVKIGICAVLLCGSWYLGFNFEASRFEKYKADQIAKIHEKEVQHQKATDEIRKAKDEQIQSINNQLANALVQLRSRPSRSQISNNGQDGTGLSLSAEDATFLEWESARADKLRSALDACYQQYDAVAK